MCDLRSWKPPETEEERASKRAKREEKKKRKVKSEDGSDGEKKKRFGLAHMFSVECRETICACPLMSGNPAPFRSKKKKSESD